MLRGSVARHLFRLMSFACIMCATLTAYASSKVDVVLTGVGGAEYGYGSSFDDGQYVMPYYIAIGSTVGNAGTPMAVISDDYLHMATVGDHWIGMMTTLADLSGTRFGTADAMQYHEAAWIASQLTSTSSLSVVTAAQFAIWHLFTSATPMVSGEANWLAAAAVAQTHNYYGMDFSHWEVLTPTNRAEPQEYLVYIPSIPEPAALLDLFAGLFAIGAVWISKSRGTTGKSRC